MARPVVTRVQAEAIRSPSLQRIEVRWPPPHPRQFDIVQARERFVVVSAGRRFGKALALDTPIPTPNGWTTMGELNVGDSIFGSDGQSTTVTFATEIQHGRPCYEVVFSDGSTVVADADHQWETWDHPARKTARRRVEQRSEAHPAVPRCHPTIGPKVRTTEQIRATLRHGRRQDTNHSIRLAAPVHYPERDLPIDPYVLGAWLGDGTSRDAQFTTPDPEVIAEIERAGYLVVRRDDGQSVRRGSINYWIGGRGAPGQRRNPATGRYQDSGTSLIGRLRELGVLGNKHVPRAYLEASVEQREALLAGLMDTDGTISKGGACCFDSMTRALADAVYELVCSLGFKATRYEKVARLNGKDCGVCYRVAFTPHRPVFRLPRKLSRQRLDHVKRTQYHRYIVDVRPVASVPVRCIQVDAADSLFLAGRSFIPTHNTRIGALMCVITALNGGRAWWIAPSFAVAQIGWEEVQKLAAQIPGTRVVRGDKIIYFPTGGWVQVKSAVDPDSLRGRGLDLVVFDEAAFIRERAWTEAIRPALSDRRGRALFISTPFGRNWFYRLWMRGEDPAQPEWRSFKFPTAANPFIPASEIEAARHGVPELTFQQEYLADFVDDTTGVFRKVDRACVAVPQERGVPTILDERGNVIGVGHEYAYGIDWGKVNDFTVISVIDLATREQVAFERFNQIDYTIQLGRVYGMVERFPPKIMVVEQNSIGEPLIEQLRRKGLPVWAFSTTGHSKQALIEDLILAFEQERIRILDEPVQTRELKEMVAEKLPSGIIRYAAVENAHDDTVMALALSWKGYLNFNGDIRVRWLDDDGDEWEAA